MKINNIRNYGVYRWPEQNAVSEWVITEDGKLFMKGYLLGNGSVEEREENSKQAKWEEVLLETNKTEKRASDPTKDIFSRPIR